MTSRGQLEEVTPLVARVFAELSDGRFHSGEQLAEALGVTRSAVWKAVRAMKDLGATLHAVRNRGYRLTTVDEPLMASAMLEGVDPGARPRIRRLDVHWSIGSTNTVLLERPFPPEGSSEVCLAEYQTAGRGRRGRTWVAPPGGSICLSLSWTFESAPGDLGALGLVVGVCAVRAMRELGVQGAKLKWPNDVWVEDRKLGGVLIELRAEAQGPACAVIGIGLNVALGTAVLESIAAAGGVAPIDLVTAGLARPGRNKVAAALISACVAGLVDFGRHGLRPFIGEWQDVDALRGRPVDVSTNDGVSRGIARGIDIDGALLLETPQGLFRFISGDVTVRLS